MVKSRQTLTGQTLSEDQKKYCCCRMFPILNGLYFMSIHCIIQGTFGACLVASSAYRKKSLVINYCAGGGSSLFILTGLCVLWGALYDSWKMMRACSCLMVVTTFLALVTYIFYFIYYIDFNANSSLDATLFWTVNNDWLKKGDLPFTFWHIFTAGFIVLCLIGWYYAYILHKCAGILIEIKAENRNFPTDSRPSRAE